MTSNRFHLRTLQALFFVIILTSLLLMACTGEKKPEVYHVGILSGLDGLLATVDGFKEGMNELGYVEGNNIVYDFHRTNFDPMAEKRILRKFVADRVDVIFVFPSEVVAAAKAITQGTGIPIIISFTIVEGTDLIKSVSEPGGNITGVRFLGTDLAVKRFEILNALVPLAKRIWVPYASKSPVVPTQLSALRPVAERAGVTLVEAPAENATDLLAALETMAKRADIGIDAILLISEPLAKTPEVFSKMGKLAYDHKIPIGGAPHSLGGYATVFGVYTNHMVVGRMAAHQAHKILKGIPAGTIPLVSAESYLHINYKAAKQIGLNVPEGLLKQADEIIR